MTLPLYPGECNVPNASFFDEAQDRIHDSSVLNTLNYTLSKESSDKFTPTPVVYVGNEAIKNNTVGSAIKETVEIYNIPWKNEKENKVDSESESSRAFNTKVNRFTSEADKSGDIIREVVEPILKPHSTKNARSHDINKDKPEITEPILGPTTSRNRANFKQETQKDDLISKLTKNDKEIIYNFYDIEDENEWVPSVKPLPKSEKWKREDESGVLTSLTHATKPPTEAPNGDDNFNLIAMTVQILPQRLARMFEQAEKYARETILPFVSTYTPKFISDFIAPTTQTQTRYLPLSFEQTTVTADRRSDSIPSTPKVANNKTVKSKAKSKTNDTKTDTTTETAESTTKYTHIQRIVKKKENEPVMLVFPLSTTEAASTTVKSKTENFRSAKSDEVTLAQAPSEIVERIETTKKPNESKIERSSTGIYIDLPVFDEKEKEIKYIPVSSFTENPK